MPKPQMTWVLEDDVFAEGDCLREGAIELGHRVVSWSDEWWGQSALPKLDGPVVFHGSLESADRIARNRAWSPGAFCNTDNFSCSAWYPAAKPWLLHDRWDILPASRFVAESEAVFQRLSIEESVFVRPNSPLKPFSGRVLQYDQITLASLDHGFYYDDPDLMIVVAPVRHVEREWRYVVADRQVIAGSAYVADGRRSTQDDPHGPSWQFADEIARNIPSPDPVFVLDVCVTDGELKLVELNPFSGADLYACSGSTIVRQVAEMYQST